jgi:tRNA(Ile)-lysidine synthase
MTDKLYDRFLNYIREHRLFTPDDRPLLAVSGGVDSMVLLHLFARTEYRYGVAHCNFHLRGEEGDEDALSVERRAAELGVPYHGIDFDTMAEAAQTGESVEMAARRLRYDWFRALCAGHGYTRIVIAHHSDDSIETFFINLIRGTGLRGLTGIHTTNGPVIRPLLFATRKEILEYAHARGVAFREDSSNRTTKYLRNKIRLGIIPRIREISPEFGPTMTRNVERLSNALRFIDRQMDGIRRQISEQQAGGTVFALDLLDPELPEDYVIFELLRPYGFNADVTADLLRALDAGHSGSKFYAPEWVAWLDRRRIIVRPIGGEPAFSATVDRHEAVVFTPAGLLSFETLEREDVEDLHQPSDIALLAADRLVWPLTVRLWQEGDSFVPFGMTGRKKVSDFLIDEKASLPDKQRQLAVVSAGEIVWLVGRRIDDRFRITDGTTHVLRVARREPDEIT